MREAADKVLAPDLGSVDAEAACRDVHQALDHVGGFRPSRTPVGIDRRGVGVDGIDLGIDGRNIVLTGQQGRVEIGRHAR